RLPLRFSNPPLPTAMNPTFHPFQKVTSALFRVLLSGLFLLAIQSPAQAAWLKKPADFSNYDTPLYDQITQLIQVKIQSRLGDGRSPRDRYFIIPFAYQNRGNDPKFSHSFMTVIRVVADKRQSSRTAGL